MLQSLALALGLLNLLHVKSLSVLTDSVQNVTQLDTTDIDSKNLDVVRQLLNQETIIRIALMKNVHSLMKDMVDLKQSMEKLETSQQRTEIKLTTLQQEVNELKRENENLRLENRRHEETIGETKENFTEMHEHILQFAGTIEGKREAFEKNTTTILGDLKVEVRYLSITLLDLNKHTLEKDKSIPALIEEKYDILSTKLNASLESLNNDLLASSARISKSVLDLENRQKSFVSSMFDDINKTIGDIRNDVKQSQYDHMKLSSAVSSLEVFRINVTRNKCDIAQRSSKNNQLISNITSLLEETRSNLTSLSSNFNQEIQAIHNNISMISGSVHDLKRQISFFAKLSRSVRITKRHQTVVYDLAQTNNENGYNPKNGIFTCPQSGTYVFMWNTLIYVRTYIRLEIVVSGTALYGILEDTEEAGDYDSATGSVIVNLNVGDKVFIRSRDSGPGPLYLDSSIVTSSFSGYRI